MYTSACVHLHVHPHTCVCVCVCVCVCLLAHVQAWIQLFEYLCVLGLFLGGGGGREGKGWVGNVFLYQILIFSMCLSKLF